MSAHTPGPWKWFGDILWGGPRELDEVLGVADDGQSAVLIIENGADRALIARAPELLAENDRLREDSKRLDFLVRHVSRHNDEMERVVGENARLREAGKAVLSMMDDRDYCTGCPGWDPVCDEPCPIQRLHAALEEKP